MFARSVSFHLKTGRRTEFTQTFERDIIPMLRKHKGFRDEIAFVAPNGTDAVGISFWDLKENADAYARSGYTSVLKSMEQVVEGTPQVQSYEVNNSTFYKIAASVTA
jgi:hypothetical protein